MPSASDYTSQKNSAILVTSEVYSAKNKVSTQASQLALLKRTTGPRGYVSGGGGGGGGSDVGAYVFQPCDVCPSFVPPPTGYLNSDGTFTYTSGGGFSQNYSSSQVFKITSNGTPSDKDLTIYYNSLTSGATYTVTLGIRTYILSPGRFIY